MQRSCAEVTFWTSIKSRSLVLTGGIGSKHRENAELNVGSTIAIEEQILPVEVKPTVQHPSAIE
jgi:hypothetical protein